MRRHVLDSVLIVSFILAASIAPLATTGTAAETDLKSTVVSVGLFKNGLAVVKRQVKLPGAGVFTLSDMPEPIHGTWSVQCEAPVETRVSEREVPMPLSSGDVDFQTLLAGKQDTFLFRAGHIP